MRISSRLVVKNKRFGCIAIICFMLVFCGSAYLIFPLYRDYQIRRDPDRLARAFAEAFERRDLEETLSYVAPEKERELKLYLHFREELTCKISWETFYENIDDGWLTFGLVSEDETTKYYNYTYNGTCATRSDWHYFYLPDIAVERNGDGWIVVDWGEIDEWGP